MDRTRASDTEREHVVRLLGAAAAEGRLTVEDLERRSGAAYAATTRGELAALVDDLPIAPIRPAPPPSYPPPAYPAPPPLLGCRPSMAGDLPFSIQWRGPANPRHAGAQVMEQIVPLFQDAGYEIVERRPDRLVLRRKRSEFAELMVRTGIVTPTTVTIAMADRGDHSLIEVYGVAPQRVRAGLARLAT